jgi:hypothetical protein
MKTKIAYSEDKKLQKLLDSIFFLVTHSGFVYKPLFMTEFRLTILPILASAVPVPLYEKHKPSVTQPGK